jgi:hypothetical protein
MIKRYTHLRPKFMQNELDGARGKKQAEEHNLTCNIHGASISARAPTNLRILLLSKTLVP